MALLLVLPGCYIPVLFDAEVEITRTGFYSMVFDGYLADTDLFDAIRRKTLSPSDEKTRTEALVRDLKRDSAMREVSVARPGVFKVNWQRKGDLLKARMVTFFQRNEAILTAKFVATTNTITVEATPVGDEAAQKLAAMGLSTKGQLRVKTDAKVRRHNATRVVDQGLLKIYVWDVAGFEGDAPKIDIEMR